MIRIRHLFISPGHNYFGHQGQTPGNHPVRECDRVECVAGRGIRGDRFFDYRPDYKGAITFFSWEVFQSLLQALQLPPDTSPAVTRRNVILEGVDLNTLIGREFEVQGVHFAGVEECRPCFWMNEAFGHPRAEEWLRGRGGLRARILTSGWLSKEV